MRSTLPWSFLFALSLATAARTQVVPEIEPNNSAATANLLTLGHQVQCSLTPGDHDWFAFSLAAPRKVILFTSAPGSGSIDTVMELYDAALVTLAYNDDSRGVMSDLSINLPPGSYFVRVAGYAAGTAGNYSLDAGETTADTFNVTELEPNNSAATAQPLPSGACVVNVDAELTDANDQDWYTVTLPTQSGVWLLINEGVGGFITQHRYEFHVLGGGPLPANHGVSGGDNSGLSGHSWQVRCWAAGTYHVVIKSRLGGYASSPFDKNPFGKYRLQWVAIPMLYGASPAEVEPLGTALNNTIATATPIAPGDQGIGYLETTIGDVDVWGPLTVTTPSTLMVQTRGTSSPALVDSTIQLQDEKGNILATATTGNLLAGNTHARLTAVLVPEGTTYYYLRVSGPPGTANSTGNYVLEVGLVPCSAYVSSGYGKKEDNATCIAPASGYSSRIEYSTLGTREVPVLGTTFVREATLMQPGALLFHLAGFSDTLANGSIPLPFNLAPFGAPSCDLTVDPMIVTFGVADPAGRATFADRLPSSTSFLGFTVYEQVAVLVPGANPLGLLLSNSLRYWLGNRSY